MGTFGRLINLFSALQETYKQVNKIERNWYTSIYVDQHFGILCYDTSLERKLFDEIYIHSKNKTLNIIVYTDNSFLELDLQNSKQYILFNLSKKSNLKL